MDKTPIYKNSSEFARTNGELEQFRASRLANMACKDAIEAAIQNHFDGHRLDSRAAVQEVVKNFGYERTLYVLAATVTFHERDDSFSLVNKTWAQTDPLFQEPDSIRRSPVYMVTSVPELANEFLDTARRGYLLSLPLKQEDIEAEAQNILSCFRTAREPNSPNKTHYMVQVSPEFLIRASTKDRDRLMAMLPFRTLALSSLNGHEGIFALIRREEDRSQPLRLPKPSVRKKLREQPDTLRPAHRGKAMEQTL